MAHDRDENSKQHQKKGKKKKYRGGELTIIQKKLLIMAIGVGDAQTRPSGKNWHLWFLGSLYEALVYSGSVHKWMKREDKRMKRGDKNHPGQGHYQ